MNSKGTITLDWGCIFDILSICNVKVNLCTSKSHRNEQNFVELGGEIEKQIGEYKYAEIMDSPAYQDLYEINAKIFDLVNQVKRKPEIGKEIDEKNYERFVAKNNLQNAFFNSNISEVKDGY